MAKKSSSTADRLNYLESIIKTQKVIILMELVLIMGLMILSAYLGSLPKTVPWVIELSADGEAHYISNVESQLSVWTPSDATTRYFISHYVQSLRSVSTDNNVNKENVADVYSKSLDGGTDYIDSFYRNSNPIEVAKSTYVKVPLDELSVVAYSADQWKVTWRETAYRRSDHSIIRDEQREAVFTVSYYIPDTDRRRRENPIGLYITGVEEKSVRSLI